MQGNDQPDDQGDCQAACAPLADTFLPNHARDRVGWDRVAEGLDSQGTAELAFAINPAYSESHGVTPWLTFDGGTRKYAIEVAPMLI